MQKKREGKITFLEEEGEINYFAVIANAGHQLSTTVTTKSSRRSGYQFSKSVKYVEKQCTRKMVSQTPIIYMGTTML